ncbi:LLM class flavin-dependent oxidoreductase [Pantoea sp. DY-17]|uniref:LLM class flavin-dependent oxidoreductase n=1 Tax=Pantoea sp. DY-17 TaxID=2871490 RepID=UPI001C948A48|nr:LLM class flavin-dependent oxidoreductase [Pantoea sp. DY-17]MBY4954568.1 LLM class flavin-dependent oxidoreductase [Pantoea sp. DY-17]
MKNSTARKLIINVNVLDFGHSGSARAYSGLPADTVMSADYYAELGRIAERGTLDAFFLADHPSLTNDPRSSRGARALEPTAILTTVAEATTHLGLVGTLSTTYNDPVELADRFLTLDHISGGRAAWNAVTTYSAATGPNFGAEVNPDRETRYRRAEAFVDVVAQLWRAAYYGHDVNINNQDFQVHGRLALPGSAQGYPLFIQAGGSDQGRSLAGRTANGVFAAEMVLSAAQEHYQYVKNVAVAHGRKPEEIAILPGLVTVIGSTQAEAEARELAQKSKEPGDYEIHRLSEKLGFDLSLVDPDDLLPQEAISDYPDPQLFKGSMGFREASVRLLRERPYTVREAVSALAGSGHKRIVGTPEAIADFMEEWFLSGGADGFNLMPDILPSGLEDFVNEVVPLLRKKGIFREQYEDKTLRERWNMTVQ